MNYFLAARPGDVSIAVGGGGERKSCHGDTFCVIVRNLTEIRRMNNFITRLKNGEGGRKLCTGF
ncbi:MAG TPA: hypothetical protein VMH30_01745 [Verrucomicrobiae bacterium]|nr:hypothetical protein [Verrucomicrobiae bacterium]